MTRRHLTFPCEGAALVGTLDDAPGRAGLLIVSGGSEIRAGAWNGQALLAARLAAIGIPVFRFDRRGIGDSEGIDQGFRGAMPDVRAALVAFRAAAPQVERVVGWGNCDAASTLMLGGGLGCDRLVLSNPWTIEEESCETSTSASPGALRAHYARRLRDPAALLRLLLGGVSIAGLLQSLRDMACKPSPSTLATEMAAGLARFAGPARILIAERDRTAQTFLDRWDKSDPQLARCPAASHSFVETEAQRWLEDQLVEVLISDFD